MNKKNFALATTLVLSSINASAAVLSVDHDFYSYGGGYSDNDRMIINNAGPSSGFEAIAFMSFDLTSLPTSHVDSATLDMQMYCNSFLSCTGTSSDTMEISINQVGIDVASVTDSTGVAALTGSIGSSVDTLLVGAEGMYSWDITSLVNSWIDNPLNNLGFAITARTGTSGGTYNDYFHSSASTTGAFPVITTVSAVPVPAAVWLFGSGLIGMVGVARRRAS